MSDKKLWGGRFQRQSAKILEIFNASLPFDKELYEEDIKGSTAHALMLGSVGILSQTETKSIVDGLEQIKKEIEKGEFEFDIKDEDIHMAVEKRLTKIIGEVGGKLHTARSRNDQVAVDFRLYTQKYNKILANLLKNLIKTLVELSKNHTTTLMPGYTHLQHAQPINFAFHLLAYAFMFKRDLIRFEDSYKRCDILPLGCAALAGTPHKIDRKMTAELLGFGEISQNCLDTVSDRDFALEILFNISTMMMHISRLSEELILWSSSEFGFITLSDEYSTGSSIMPQKKNPDVPELLRGKTGRVNGNLIALLTTLKGLPLAYNKDMQEDKEGVFDSIKTAQISLLILNELIKTMKINEKAMQEATQKGHLSATDLADFLVSEFNEPFRNAHFIVGKLVAKAESKGVDLSELSLDELREVDERLNEKAKDKLNLQNSMNARVSYGGAATKAVLEQIRSLEEWLG